ncbi:MAG TPA: helix-turn-helix domain-containing protein [Solirubrobacteraceae bacterium]|jgi:DNA-binding HxlR family transcriptional regulator|nr:helix-turn-helix domain-containing protein [Solirubrobacteraceae bacterium]
MLGRDYTGQTCSIARTLEVIGERWTMLIVRDVFLGLRRFDDIQGDLGVARNVLASRLERLVEAGVLEKAPYQQRPTRYEYRLTDKGRDLWPLLIELVNWGDRHAPAPGGPPVVYRHRGCGGPLGNGRQCGACGAVLERGEILVEAGPGATADHPIHRRIAASG